MRRYYGNTLPFCNSPGGVEPETLSRAAVISSLIVKTDQDMRNFARNVKPRMRALGLSTTTLAARAGVSTKTLNNALNARHAAQSDVLSAIAAALKTPLWELLLPDLPDDIAHDDTLPQLLKTVSQLGAEARRNVAHIADLELSKNRRG